MKPQLKEETLKDLENSVNYVLKEIFEKSNDIDDLEYFLKKYKIDFWYGDDYHNDKTIIYLSYHILDITKLNLQLCLNDIINK